MFEATIQLSDALRDADERIQDIREAYHDLKDFATEEYGTVEAAPETVQDRFDRYEQEWQHARGLQNVIETTLADWAGPTQTDDGGWTNDEFAIRMLSGADLAQVEDRVGAAQSAMNEETGVLPQDMQGERVIEVLEASVVDAPDGSPTDGGEPAPGEYPWHVMIWLFERVNNLNTAGDPNFEASGFEDAMERT